MKILIRFFVLASVGTYAQAAENCADAYYIDATLQNGSRWDLCWEHRSREGIVFHHIYYTPKNGERKMVLNQASVAQIHVPYDDNGARYHDVSDYGIGGDFLYDLKQHECPGGQLLKHSSKNVLCRQIENRPFAYRHDADGVNGQALSLFSVSHVGAYNYIPQWRFFDDGKFEPWMGATGALQRFGSGNVADRGWKMADDRIGLGHLHNFYWRLDFDLGGTANDDFVEEINFNLSSGKRERSTTKFSDEVAREVNPATMRSWRIVDGNSKNSKGHTESYEILLNETGFKDNGNIYEAFTQNDFFVTKQRACEIFASHNPTTDGCGVNLDQFANGESINNQDIVIWAGVTFYHMPRSEDAPHMDAHWNHFQVIPRDWHGVNPLSGGSTNAAPQITQQTSQNSREGDSIQLAIQASDADGDNLTYSASGLPEGLSIHSNSGLISGTLASGSAGDHTISVSVSDDQASAGITFIWTVTAVATNQPPEISTPVDQNNQEGDTPNLNVEATDPDGDVLSYSASGLPGGLSIDGASGLISGTLNSSSAGTHNVTVSVSDGHASRNTSFEWVVTVVPVNNPPQITNPGDQNNQEGETVSLTIEASDPDGDSLSYSAIGLPDGVNIETTTGEITGTLTNGAVGSHSVTVSVFDGRISKDATFSWGITGVSANQPPQVTDPGHQSNHPGDSVNINVQASDPDGDGLTYTASGLPSGLRISSSTGVIFGTLATDSAGNYNVTVNVNDGQANGTVSFDWTVTAISTGPVFSDTFETDQGWQVNPNGSDSATTGIWDRAVPEATNYSGTALQLGDPVSGQYDLVTGHKAGNWVGADDIDSGITSAQSPAISLSAGSLYELSLSYYFAHIRNATSADFLRITVKGNNGRSQIVLEQRGNGTIKAASWQSLSVDVSDFAGDTIHVLVEAADTGSGSLIEAAIDDVVITGSQGSGNQSPQISNPGNQSDREGDSVSLAIQANDADGDSLTYSATGLPNGLTINSNTGVISGTVPEGSAGDYSVNINVNDGQSNGSVSFNWNITAVGSAGTVFNDDFETDLGWEIDPNGADTATTGLWERAIPEATGYSGLAQQLGNTVSGQYDLVTGRRAGGGIGADDIDGGITSAKSPAIALAAGGTYDLSLSYYFAHLWNTTTADFLRITIQGGNGQSQVILDKRGANNTQAAIWQNVTVDVSGFAGQTIHLSIEAADGDGSSLVEAGIDDVRITRR